MNKGAGCSLNINQDKQLFKSPCVLEFNTPRLVRNKLSGADRQGEWERTGGEI